MEGRRDGGTEGWGAGGPEGHGAASPRQSSPWAPTLSRQTAQHRDLFRNDFSWKVWGGAGGGCGEGGTAWECGDTMGMWHSGMSSSPPPTVPVSLTHAPPPHCVPLQEAVRAQPRKWLWGGLAWEIGDGEDTAGEDTEGGSGAFSPCPLWGCLASGNAAIGASAPRVFPPGGIPRPQMLTPPHPTRVPIPRRAPTRRVTLHPQPQSAVPLPTPFLTPNPIALPHHSPPVAAPHPRRVPVSLHGALSLDTCPQPPWNSTPHRSPTPSPSLPIAPSQSPNTRVPTPPHAPHA